MDRNFINLLSLSRIPLSILFSLAIIFLKRPLFICILLSIVIYFTDYYDGKLARSYNIASGNGSIIDVISDVFFVVVSLFTLYSKKFIPFWVIIVIFLKFVEFCITSYHIEKNNKNIIVFKYDNFGRFVAALFYILPLFTLLVHSVFTDTAGYRIMSVVCFLITILTLVSSVLRIRFFYKK